MSSLREKLEPDYGEKDLLDEEGNLLSKGGPIRRHFNEQALLPEVVAFRTLAKVAEMLTRDGRALFRASPDEDVLFRMNPSAVKTYFYIHQVGGDYVGQIAQLGFPTNWQQVSVRTVREQAWYRADQIDSMFDALMEANNISEDEFYHRMKPYDLLTRPFSE